jgi:uncharacterized protein YjdB
MDGVFGLGKASSTSYTTLAVIVRFNPSGQIDARNGANYSAVNAFNYAGGTAYHFTVSVNTQAHTYSVWVHQGTNADVQIANNYTFRTEQAAINSVGDYTLHTENNSESVCNLTTSAAALPVSVTIAPTLPSVTVGGTVQFTASVANADNATVTWSANGGTIDQNGLFSGSTIGSFSVTATSVADPTKSSSTTVTVKAPPPTLSIDCTKITPSTIAPAITYTNIPSGTVFNISITAAGLTATCAGMLP